ncbi:hypothetical protein MKEN_00804100 [Mycena kentingensis (nom. inval.)]|nr:hypothetical protein MKEN_00804100 [Mycena kentingensis (nom. inval.)]
MFVGQINTSNVPHGISLVKINVSNYGEALHASFIDEIDHLYTNDSSAPLGTGAGLRHFYEFGLYSRCAWVNGSAGVCTNTTFQQEYRPYDSLTSDMAANYTDITNFIFHDATFVDSEHLFGPPSRAAFWMIFLGTICAALALLTGLAKSSLTFFLSTAFALLGSIFILVGAAIWTVLIKRTMSVNAIMLGTAANPVQGMSASTGTGLYLLWAAFASLVVSVVPYMIVCCLDNLPNEVAHILEEIKHLDHKATALQNDIDKDSARYIRHSLKLASSAPSSTSASPSPAPDASRSASAKDQAISGKIEKAFEEIHALNADKVALSQRLIDLVTRTRARLDAELVKVRILQGDEQPTFSRVNSAAAVPSDVEIYVGASRNPLPQPIDSPRNVLGPSSSLDARVAQAASPSPSASMSGQPPQKKRRVAAQAATPIKLAPVVAPTPPRRSQSPLTSASAHAAQHKRSRLSRQIMDIDVDGDDEGEADGEGEDENLYCFCQKQSYGDMIACDNDDCPYEWFHLSCVQLTQPPSEKWYCRECIDKFTGPGRKGRKR